MGVGEEIPVSVTLALGTIAEAKLTMLVVAALDESTAGTAIDVVVGSETPRIKD